MSTPNESNKLYLYSASAGAGKTTTITRQYIRLALSSPNNYRHIQAVTFTNKATEEMKQRILSELHKITTATDISNEDSADNPWRWLFCDLSENFNKSLTVEELQARARTCLRGILLNYDHFRISTIDSFFQEILRSFARELNLPTSFRIELESKKILKEACQAVFVDEKHRNGSPILKWITKVALSLLKRAKNHDPIVEIEKLSEELKKDEVRAIYLHKHKQESGEAQSIGFPSIEDVEQLEQHTQLYISKVVAILDDFTEEAFRLIKPALEGGLTLSYGESGAFSIFYSIQKRDFDKLLELPKRLLDALESPETKIFKSSKNQDTSFVDFTAIQQLLCEFVSFATGQEMKIFWSATMMQEMFPSFGLLSAIDAKVREIQKHNNSLLLADAPGLIQNILEDDGGVPFLYERIGTKIKHHMIDEFQDTSLVQYNNFKPLLEDSLAYSSGQQQDSIIVGDVKQSIYRWRGSDSNLITSLGENTLWHCDKRLIKENWRSASQIVNFNNELYRQLSESIKHHFYDILNHISPDEDLTDLANIFTNNYADVGQIAQQKQQGHICIHRYAYESDKELHEESQSLSRDTKNKSYTAITDSVRLRHQLPRQLDQIQQRGYSRGDIAILVRDNSEAAYIAKLLLWAESHGGYEAGRFNFISNEALAPTEALAVNFAISALHYIIDPDNAICREEFITLHSELTQRKPTEDELQQLCNSGRKSLYETLELIIAHYKEFFSPGECPHLIKLLDEALSYQQDLSLDIADFIEMWQEYGSSRYLTMTPDKDKIQIMTIHKAKGLDFPVVLLPFLNWELAPKASAYSSKTLWCDNPFYQQTGISKVPIKAKSALLKTTFAIDYAKEWIQESLDALNILYVATTRAKDEMHLWLLDPEYGKIPQSGEIKLSEQAIYHKTIADLLLAELYLRTPQAQALKYCTTLQAEEQDNYSTARQSKKNADKKLEPPIIIKSLESYDIADRIEELRDGLQHFEQDRRRHYGNLMHHILSDIERSEDKERALLLALNRGELNREDMPEVEQRLDSLLSCPKAQSWFDGSGTILNESTILGAPKVSRPDRVISYGNMDLAVIVDYKFGKPSPRYQKQIERYAKLLKAMGYKRVEGYLWYLQQKDEDDRLFTEGYEEPQLVYTL